MTEDQLSQAIGRSGQNVRLASELTGWTLNVMTEGQAEEKHESETLSVKELFAEKLDVDIEVAEALANEGFSTVEEVAYVPAAEMMAIEGFDSDIVEELQKRASDYLLMQEIADEAELAGADPEEDLLSLEGVTERMAKQLAKSGVKSRDDLADQSIDELKEIIEIDDESAAKLIMKAREHWFEEATD